MAKLLLVEDEERAAAYLRTGLAEHGFVVDVCHDGEEGLHNALAIDYALIILDVMLPGCDVVDRPTNSSPRLSYPCPLPIGP